jgi:branched-chain amino acid transport system ATP-binding protein
MLRISELTAGYHGGTVLHGVSLAVDAGAVQAIVGRNGAGKSTLVHAVAGLLRPYSGMVVVDGADLAGKPAHRIARAGVGLVPQGRRVFPSLTVAEHLALAVGRRRAPAWTLPRVLELLPRLGERLTHRGDQLSGGEQQMLAIARALLTQPRVLLLDEPSEGLATDLAARVRDLVADLAGTGLSVLLVEQQLDHAIEVADRIAVLDYGRLVFDEPTATVRADPGRVQALLSIDQPLRQGS